MTSIDHGYVQTFAQVSDDIARESAERHPQWLHRVTAVLNTLTMWSTVGSREELEREVEIAMVSSMEEEAFYGEYLLRQLTRLREVILTPAERDELDAMATDLAADLQAEKPDDPEQTKWDAFGALIMSQREIIQKGCLRCCAPKCLCGPDEAAAWHAITGLRVGNGREVQA